METLADMEATVEMIKLETQLNEDTVSQQTLQKIESLEVLEEALTVIKGIPEPRIIWKDSTMYNEKLLKRIFNDDMEGNTRTKALYAEHELRQGLLREHKYSEIKKKITEAFDQRAHLLQNACKYQLTVFCPFGRVLIFQLIDDIIFNVFEEGLIIIYERSKTTTVEPKEILAITEDSLACACVISQPQVTLTEEQQETKDRIIDLFLVANDSKSETECSIVRCYLKAGTDSSKRTIRLERLQQGNIFGKETCSRPNHAVYCPAHQCIVTTHDSVVYLIAITQSTFEIRVRLDLTATLRLPATPPNQSDIHRITSIASRGSQVYASMYSGTLTQIQIGIGATSLRPSILQQYGALETRAANSDRFREVEDDNTDADLDMVRMIAEEKQPIKFSYAPTTVSCMILSRSESIYSACGDGTIRVQSITSNSPEDEACFLNMIEYNDAGYLPSCLQITASKSANLLVSCDANNRLCLWNLSTQEIIGICSMEGIKNPYNLYLDVESDLVVVFASDVMMFWTYNHDIIPEVVRQSSSLDKEPSLSRSRTRL